MLKTLDVLIGFVLIMLIMSMVVTMLTQAAVTASNNRGLALRHGIADLLALLDRTLTPDDAKKLADRLLRDPLVAGANLLSPGRRHLAVTVHREELTKLILEFAAADRSQLTPQEQALQLKTINSLRGNQIDNPQQTLDAIRNTALELEKSHPEMANNDRMNTAILHNASSIFLAKLNAWFDPTIDRVKDHFTAHARIWTVLAALIVAAALQLDAIGLINRLSVDDKLREALVQDVIAHPEKYDPSKQPAGSPSDQLNALKNLKLDELTTAQLIELPVSYTAWWEKWRSPTQIVGVIISAVLMSLGAPFWYEMLKNLVRLRSLISTKDDAQRNERQTTQTPAATPNPTAALVGGERGDLAATG